MRTRHIALTGTSGVGKTTIAATAAAALTEKGLKTAVVSCRRTRFAAPGENERPIRIDRLTPPFGFHDIVVVDAGNYLADTGDGGRGLGDLLDELGTEGFAAGDRDAIFYDLDPELLGRDLDRPGGASPIDRIFVLTTSDIASLRAVNGLFAASSSVVSSRFGGVIGNRISGSFAWSLVSDYAQRVGDAPLVLVPSSLTVMMADLFGETVIQAAPDSNQAFIFRRLADNLLESGVHPVPPGLAWDEFASWAVAWGERLRDLETGQVAGSGAGI